MIFVVVLVAILAGSLATYTFIDKFGIGYWDTIDKWGATGDFFGGMLNPLFAFLSLILIAFTLKQNKKALEQSNEALLQNKAALDTSNLELELSREEFKKSVKALESQVDQANMQRFDSTFFSLLDQLNSTNELKSLDFVYKNIMRTDRYSNLSAPDDVLKLAKSFLVDKGGDMNLYFMTLYQVLKFISNNHPESNCYNQYSVNNLEASNTTPAEKTYANMIRARIGQQLLILLAVNCYHESDDDQFYSYYLLIKRYSFLSHTVVFKLLVAY
jgi:hypothetical protein